MEDYLTVGVGIKCEEKSEMYHSVFYLHPRSIHLCERCRFE